MNTRKPRWTIFLTLLALVIVVGCLVALFVNFLPPPEVPCSSSLANTWRGITPGKSTRDDALRVLGQPTTGGIAWIDSRLVSYLAYRTEGGIVRDFRMDRIYFTVTGAVDWMEIVVADRDGKLHSVKEVADPLGSSVDVVFPNTNLRPGESCHGSCDVLGGPDDIYVWANCGVAVHALSVWRPAKTEAVAIEYIDEQGSQSHAPAPEATPALLSMRYPGPFPGAQATASTDNVVLMKVLFSPTSYRGFMDYYAKKLPFETRTWLDYVDRIPEVKQ